MMSPEPFGSLVPPGYAEVVAAQTRIAGFIHRTPVFTSDTIDALAGTQIFFKCENFQKIGAFKARGAHNAVFSLPEKLAKAGVVTHSSGNHAAALALAARNRGVSAHIVMPLNAPKPKIASVRRLGGLITFCEPTLVAREAAAEKLQNETGAILVHPYNNREIIAGQGTAALELLSECPDLDSVLTPVGGGGLLSGTALAAREHRRNIKVFGVEPAGADDACRSFRSGRLEAMSVPNTVADGLRVSLGSIPFSIIRSQVDDIVTVGEEAIIAAMQLIWEVLKIVIEPSAAVPVAALLERRLTGLGSRTGVVLSGGNVDLQSLPWSKIS